ncbi:DMT family transporter [Jeotgalibacillus aurantiacus]|uniref:DMT family transporter n=1 Tax=Jeotgalibacillus aurantiacus TaxID=2763266 RepID=UPI001D0BC625|nr:DMT family transporter [Jeotgalibacillus aurantiacus]
MKGILFAVLAGVFIALHGAFNTKMGESVSMWHTVVLVHFIGFVLAFIIFLSVRKSSGESARFSRVPPVYLLGGTFGLIVLPAQMASIEMLGMSLSITLLLVAQIVCAFLIDALGLFGTEKRTIHKKHVAGLVMMLAGVVLFQL